MIVLSVALAAYATLVIGLVVAGRKGDARALVRLVPDCVVLFKRLLTDPRVDWWRKAILVLVIVYVASPIDLVPDFVPIPGQLDDALLVVLALRGVLRSAGPVVVAEHWLGSQSALAILSRVAAPRSRRAGAAGGRRWPWG
jgi:uncharacterized membrane protein YkvA (DUF1232 family)